MLKEHALKFRPEGMKLQFHWWKLRGICCSFHVERRHRERLILPWFWTRRRIRWQIPEPRIASLRYESSKYEFT